MTSIIKEIVAAIDKELKEKPDKWQEHAYWMEKKVFDEIVIFNKGQKKGVYFPLRENWKLLKDQKYHLVLNNIQDWLKATEDR